MCVINWSAYKRPVNQKLELSLLSFSYICIYNLLIKPNLGPYKIITVLRKKHKNIVAINGSIK